MSGRALPTSVRIRGPGARWQSQARVALSGRTVPHATAMRWREHSAMSTETTPSGSGPSGASSGYITGFLLVATPAMPDERFRRTVIYMCRHDADGALGLAVNRPVDDMTEADLYKQLEISPAPGAEIRPVILGGPVEIQRGFVLHTGDYKRDETLS